MSFPHNLRRASESPVNSGLIAGIAVAGVLFLALFTFILVSMFKRRAADPETPEPAAVDQLAGKGVSAEEFVKDAPDEIVISKPEANRMTWDPSYYYGAERESKVEKPPPQIPELPKDLSFEDNPPQTAGLLSPYPLGKSSAYQVQSRSRRSSARRPPSALSSAASDCSVYSQGSATLRQRRVLEEDVPPTPAPEPAHSGARHPRTSVGKSFPKNAGRNTQYVAQLIKNRSHRRRRSSIGVLSTISLNEEESGSEPERDRGPSSKSPPGRRSKKVPPPLPLIAVTGLSDESDYEEENVDPSSLGSVESIVITPAAFQNASPKRPAGGSPRKRISAPRTAMSRFFSR